MLENLKVLEEQGKRVLTTQQIAQMYGTTRKIISYNYQYNKKKYIEGKHYIKLEGKGLSDFKSRLDGQDSLKYAHTLYLWTEKGALLHAKSLNTDKAWEVYDYLVDFYFRAKERPEKKEIVPVEAVEDTGNSEVLPGDTDKKPFDIAPAFRQVLTMLPTEALDEMERSFRSSRNQAVKLAAVSILAEKMKRKLAE